MGRPVVHWELWSEDPEAIGEFYRKAFDWDIRAVPELDYHLVETGDEGGIKGGIFKPKQGPWPAKLTFYVDVDDLAAYGERVKQAGGTMLVEQMEVPGVGRLSLFEDPDGRVIGMWKRPEEDD